tara:strand:- start:315 stop:458 length:144 start_codon:yes stop_codon:yes gene_type:complete
MLATPKTTTKLRLRIVLIDRVIAPVHTVTLCQLSVRHHHASAPRLRE